MVFHNKGLARPSDAPYLGMGVGLRTKHYPHVLEHGPRGELSVDWFEAISENTMVPGGRPPRILDKVRAHFPVVLHGVSMNIGSTDPLDEAYLDRLDTLIRRVDPPWVSDHLCWTGVDGRTLHDLLPLPFTEETVRHVSGRILHVQERLGRRIAIENVSSYVTFTQDEMPEWDFVAEIARRADCGILLDVNNIFVSAHNHGYAPEAYLEGIPVDRVFQFHMAGHSEQGDLFIDTHDHPVKEEVWTLFEKALERFGAVSTLIEWDDHIPPFEELEAHAARAREIIEKVTGEVRNEPRPTGDARNHAAPAPAAHYRA